MLNRRPKIPSIYIGGFAGMAAAVYGSYTRSDLLTTVVIGAIIGAGTTAVLEML